MKYTKIDSYKKGIVFSSILNLGSKLLLFVQNMVLAYYFGANAKVDIFFYCFTTLTLVSTFIALLNGYVLVPESMRITKESGQKEAIRFLNVFIYLYLLFGIVVTIPMMLAPVDTFLFISNFDPQLLEQYRPLLLLSIPLFTLMIVQVLLTDILSSFKYFTAPQTSKVINSLLGLAFIFLFHKKLDVASILWGLIAGYLINIFFLIRLMRSHLHWSFGFRWFPIEKRIWVNSIYAQLGNIASLLGNYLPLYMLSGFSAGIISALNYGQRTANLPTNSITQQFSPVAGIKFNELYAAGDYNGLNQIFIKSVNALLFVLFPISGIFMLYDTELVTLVYERGAFDTESTRNSAMFLSLLGLSIPFIALNNMVSRLYMSGHKIKEYFWYQVLKNISLMVMVYYGITLWGPVGFPIAYLANNILNIFACQWMINRQFGFIHYNQVNLGIAKIFIINLVICVIARGATYWIPDSWMWAEVLLGCGLYGLMVVAFNLKFVISDDLNRMVNKVTDKLPSAIRTKLKYYTTDGPAL